MLTQPHTSPAYLKKSIFIFLILAGCWFIGQSLYIHAKAILAQQLLERAWVMTKSGKTTPRPWPWADTWPVARLQVPALKVDLIVLAGDSGRTLAFGPGHHFGSSTPGEAGHSIISAHRDTHFNFLQYLKKGDAIIVETASSLSRFKVETTQIVDRDRAAFPFDDINAYLHLVTCYPFDAIISGGPERYVVSAIKVDNTQYISDTVQHSPVSTLSLRSSTLAIKTPESSLNTRLTGTFINKKSDRVLF